MKGGANEDRDEGRQGGDIRGRHADPPVSVVVATIGRGRLLLQTVRGLLENDYPSFEVIVVDQTPEPEPDVLAFMEQHRGRVRYIRRRQPGLPDARNAGVAAARGDVVLFVDDDVIVDRRLITGHAGAYAEAGVGGVAGRVLAAGGCARDGGAQAVPYRQDQAHGARHPGPF